jgi:hypothetical protein
LKEKENAPLLPARAIPTVRCLTRLLSLKTSIATAAPGV